MRQAVTRIMVELALDKFLRDVRADGTGRAMRNLVELGARYARGRFQASLFEILQGMLRNSRHPYYALARALVEQTDERYFKRFGLNVGLESWTLGARTIRAREAERGHNVPWALALQLTDGQGAALPDETAAALTEQGSALGMRTYMLFGGGADAGRIAALAGARAECAFVAFLPAADITAATLAPLLTPGNVMPVAVSRYAQAAELTGALACLAASRCLYGACLRYQPGEAGDIMRGAWTAQLPDAFCPFLFFLCDDYENAALCGAVSEALLAQKTSPARPVFPMEFSGDVLRVDQIISDDGCLLAALADGRMLLDNGAGARAVSGAPADLSAFLEAQLPKRVPTPAVR